jgi:predicted signal transduction protein with EAL and GGDEF domain
LVAIAKRLMFTVRTSDTVSRHGGDEFIILLSSVEDADDAARSAQRVLEVLGAQHRVDSHDVEISASIGISVYPDDGFDADSLVQCADTAMLNAKKHGRNNYSFFKPHMNAQALERRFLERGLREALSRSELLLYYQPKMDLTTERMVGVEALIRWCRPKRGMTLPREFLSVAEQSGSIVPIGKWVLGEVCRQARDWRDANLPPITLAVNISANELLSKGFVDGIRSALQESGLESQYLELEMTEIALMKDLQTAAPLLRALRDMGVRLTLDHFGTGPSSLNSLRYFPIDALKIDRSLVSGLGVSDDDRAIVNAVIQMGRSLHLRVIAEGIETQAQFLALRSQQCAQGQGHYFRQPVPAKEFAKLLSTDFCRTLAI